LKIGGVVALIGAREANIRTHLTLEVARNLKGMSIPKESMLGASPTEV